MSIAAFRTSAISEHSAAQTVYDPFGLRSEERSSQSDKTTAKSFLGDIQDPNPFDGAQRSSVSLAMAVIRYFMLVIAFIVARRRFWSALTDFFALILDLPDARLASAADVVRNLDKLKHILLYMV